MKSRTFVSVAFAVLLLSFAVVPSAMADVDVAACQIVKTGYSATSVAGPMVQLVDLASTPKWIGVRQFYLSTALGNQGFATLLTAFSMGKTVWVRIAGTATPGSLVTIIYINQ